MFAPTHVADTALPTPVELEPTPVPASDMPAVTETATDAPSEPPAAAPAATKPAKRTQRSARKSQAKPRLDTAQLDPDGTFDPYR